MCKIIDLLPTLPKEELISWTRSFMGEYVIENYPKWDSYDEEFYEVLKKEFEKERKERLKTEFRNYRKKRDNYVVKCV